MSRHWNVKDSRAQQMKYNGRYPVNEMWDVRQSLIDDFRRNSSTNKYLASIERKCSNYLHCGRQNRTEQLNWKSPSFKGHLNYKKRYRYERGYQEESRDETDTAYIHDNPCGENYTDFDKEKFGNIEVIKEEFTNESIGNAASGSDEVSSRLNESSDGARCIQKEKENKDALVIDTEIDDVDETDLDSSTDIKLENKEGNECMKNEFPSQSISVNDLDESLHDDQKIGSYVKASVNQNTNSIKDSVTCDENLWLDQKASKCEDSEKKSKKHNITSYTDFVKSISKLVSLNSNENENKNGKNDEMTVLQETSISTELKNSNIPFDKKKKKLKRKSSSSTNDRILRSTRRSSRSAKIHPESIMSTQKKGSKKKSNPDVKIKKHSEKSKSSKIKKRSKYSTRSKITEKECEKNKDSEEEVHVTSTSKLKHHRRKSTSSPDDDIPLAKYTKFSVHNDSNNFEEVQNENCDLDETEIYSNCEENYLVNQNFSDVNTFCVNDEGKNKTKADIIESDTQKDENTSDVSLILINESDSDNKQDTKSQCSNDLDTANNNKDSRSEKHPAENTNNSQQLEDKLWEYLKCDYCDFMVSRKKTQSYQLMEEHLESTKHNAASVVKVSINDGELKPVYVKKEHAILYSLEKASVLPYCPTCSTVMPSVWTVQLHAKYKHGNQLNKDTYCLGKVESVANIQVPRKIDMCKQCGQRKASIQKHWKSQNHYPYILPTENQIAQYSCNVCQRHFETFFSALSHAVVHFKHKVQNLGVKVTYISKSDDKFTLLPREKNLTSWKAIEILNQAKTANKQRQWTRAQRKEFEMMSSEWKQERLFKKYY